MLDLQRLIDENRRSLRSVLRTGGLQPAVANFTGVNDDSSTFGDDEAGFERDASAVENHETSSVAPSGDFSPSFHDPREASSMTERASGMKSADTEIAGFRVQPKTASPVIQKMPDDALAPRPAQPVFLQNDPGSDKGKISNSEPQSPKALDESVIVHPPDAKDHTLDKPKRPIQQGNLLHNQSVRTVPELLPQKQSFDSLDKKEKTAASSHPHTGKPEVVEINIPKKNVTVSHAPNFVEPEPSQPAPRLPVAVEKQKPRTAAAPAHFASLDQSEETMPVLPARASVSRDVVTVKIPAMNLTGQEDSVSKRAANNGGAIGDTPREMSATGTEQAHVIIPRKARELESKSFSSMENRPRQARSRSSAADQATSSIPTRRSDIETHELDKLSAPNQRESSPENANARLVPKPLPASKLRPRPQQNRLGTLQPGQATREESKRPSRFFPTSAPARPRAMKIFNAPPSLGREEMVERFYLSRL